MKIKNFIIAATSLTILNSCEDINQAQFQQGYDNIVDDGSAEAKAAMDSLTNKGRTFPTGEELAAEVSNPGSNCVSCDLNAEGYGSSSNQPNYYPTALKNYPIPSAGCIPKSSVSLSEADSLIASQGLSTQGASNAEKQALGTMIKRVQQLNGGPLQTGMGPGGNYPFKFEDRSGSYQGTDGIHIAHRTGDSVAQLAHEWAHLIGNQGGYEKFKRYMGGSDGYRASDQCLVSGYADNVTSSGRIEGEQFAEVFTAFVTQPSLLLNNTGRPEKCKKVFQFFKDEFFGNGDQVRSCIR